MQWRLRTNRCRAQLSLCLQLIRTNNTSGPNKSTNCPTNRLPSLPNRPPRYYNPNTTGEIQISSVYQGKYPYGEVLELSMLFYEAERSGPLPADNRFCKSKFSGFKIFVFWSSVNLSSWLMLLCLSRIPYRGDSGMNDAVSLLSFFIYTLADGWSIEL